MHAWYFFLHILLHNEEFNHRTEPERSDLKK